MNFGFETIHDWFQRPAGQFQEKHRRKLDAKATRCTVASALQSADILALATYMMRLPGMVKPNCSGRWQRTW